MRIHHIEGSILNSHSSIPIAHCVSYDGKMGAGLAKILNNKFQIRNQFLNCPRTVGSLVPILRGEWVIINLISKYNFYDLPTYNDFYETLLSLRSFINNHLISKIAIPKLGCGLDQLNFSIVLNMLYNVFEFCPIDIYIYHYKWNEERKLPIIWYLIMLIPF